MIDNTDINGEFLTWVYLTVKDAPDPILWSDESGRLLRTNAAACRRFGFPSNAPAGLTIHDIDTRRDAARWSMLKDDWVKQPGNIYETQFFSRQGESIPVEVTCAHPNNENSCAIHANRHLTRARMIGSGDGQSKGLAFPRDWSLQSR